MENRELTHWGIKGMKWGVRRYQNKDGSLTPAGKKRQEKLERKAEKKRLKNNKRVVEEYEDVEKRRARALRSTDPDEILKNKDVLTTAELNDRINRINTEQRLSEMAAKNKKTGYDYVNSLIKFGKKANEVYELTNTPLGKALKKQLFGKAAENLSPDLKKVWENRNSISDEKMKSIVKRMENENKIKEKLEADEAKAKKKAAKAESESKAWKQVKDYNDMMNSTYHKKGKDIVDSSWGEKKVSDVSDKQLALGQSHIAGLLPEKIER